MSGRASDELCFATIDDLRVLISSRDISPVEVTEAILERIEQHNEVMRVYISVLRDIALDQARKAEREILEGVCRGPLHGIPFGLKDNIATKGIRTSCASLVDPDWIPDEDATVYSKLQTAGAILLGKTNLYEYAFSMNPDFLPQPLNPWRPDRTSSGSSSGSAVAVATGMAYGAIGSDTGGSGRAPANVNGVVGLKATYGRVSRAGVVPLSYSLDHVSVFTRRVADAAIMLDAISGHDVRDEYSSRQPVHASAAKLRDGIQNMRIGRARGYTHADIDPEVDGIIDRACKVLESLGGQVEDVQLPYVEHCVALQSSIMLPEASVVHHRNLRDSSERLGESALMRLDLGNVVPATAYIHAQQVRKLMRDEFHRTFDMVEIIVGPANPVRAGEAGEWTTEIDGIVIDLRQVGPEYTGIYNLAGVPAIVIPAGFTSEGTPVGLQIAGKWFDEATVLQVAHAFEQATEWHRHRPPLPIT